MPFVEINVKNEIEKQRETDPKLKKAWDESRAEYRLIGEMISLRKQENVTQKELAELTGNKQQVISREKKAFLLLELLVISWMLLDMNCRL